MRHYSSRCEISMPIVKFEFAFCFLCSRLYIIVLHFTMRNLNSYFHIRCHIYLLNMRFYIRVRSLKILQRDSHVTHSQFDERRSHWGIFKPQQLPFFSLRFLLFLLAGVSSFVCSAPVFFICSVRFLFAARLRSCLVRVRRGPS